jgi:S1-C subfamily serine protease
VAFTIYLVTAAHVVRAESETWVRLRRADGTLEDLRVSGWSFHYRVDVAVAPVDLDETRLPPYDIAVLPVPDFFPAGAPLRHPGQQIYNRRYSATASIS